MSGEHKALAFLRHLHRLFLYVQITQSWYWLVNNIREYRSLPNGVNSVVDKKCLYRQDTCMLYAVPIVRSANRRYSANIGRLLNKNLLIVWLQPLREMCTGALLVTEIIKWASYQIRKIAGCASPGNAGNVFPRHRGLVIPTCITPRAWRTCRDAWRDRYLMVSFEVSDGGNAPGIPGAYANSNFTYLARGSWIHTYNLGFLWDVFYSAMT